MARRTRSVGICFHTHTDSPGCTRVSGKRSNLTVRCHVSVGYLSGNCIYSLPERQAVHFSYHIMGHICYPVTKFISFPGTKISFLISFPSRCFRTPSCTFVISTICYLLFADQPPPSLSLSRLLE